MFLFIERYSNMLLFMKWFLFIERYSNMLLFIKRFLFIERYISDISESIEVTHSKELIGDNTIRYNFLISGIISPCSVLSPPTVYYLSIQCIL